MNVGKTEIIFLSFIRCPVVDNAIRTKKLVKRPLQSFEILELLLKHDEYAIYWRNKVKSLSVHLNKALKYKKIIANKASGRNGLSYRLPEWVDEKEKLLFHIPFQSDFEYIIF